MRRKKPENPLKQLAPVDINAGLVLKAVKDDDDHNERCQLKRMTSSSGTLRY